MKNMKTLEINKIAVTVTGCLILLFGFMYFLFSSAFEKGAAVGRVDHMTKEQKAEFCRQAGFAEQTVAQAPKSEPRRVAAKKAAPVATVTQVAPPAKEAAPAVLSQAPKFSGVKVAGDEGTKVDPAKTKQIPVATTNAQQASQKREPAAKSSVDNASTTVAAAKPLPAPAGVHPTHNADMRGRNYIRFHWDSVKGAARYHVRAWQYSRGQKRLLLDADVDGTEVRATPFNRTEVNWDLVAIDPAGNPGKTRGPIGVGILADSHWRGRENEAVATTEAPAPAPVPADSQAVRTPAAAAAPAPAPARAAAKPEQVPGKPKMITPLVQ